MQEKLQDFAQLPTHRVTDSCIVALLSHGVEGGVYGVDGKLLQVCAVLWAAAVKLGGGASRLPVLPVMAAVVCVGLGRPRSPTSLLLYFFAAAAGGVSALRQCQLPKPAEQTENVLHPGLPWR